MAVMMQAFYWDSPMKDKRSTTGGTSSRKRWRTLGKAGINALWLPPICKGAEARSMGYDPYDYFDLGDFDQKGGVKTLLWQSRRVGRPDCEGCMNTRLERMPTW